METLAGIVFSYLMDKLIGRMGDSYHSKKEEKELKKAIVELKQWINDQENQASAVASESFRSTFEHHQILEKMLKYIVNPFDVSQSELEFLNQIIRKHSDVHEICEDDICVIQQFYRGLLNKIKGIYFTKSSNKLNVIFSLMYNIDRNMVDMILRMDQQYKEITNKIYSVDERIKQEGHLLHTDRAKNEDLHYLTIEEKKYKMSGLVELAIEKKEYIKAANLKKDIAEICRNQGEERNAHLLEHSAFLLLQEEYCRRAMIELSYFDSYDLPLNVEILKVALTDLASYSKNQELYDFFAFYIELGIRLCKAQDQEDDAYLMRHELDKYKTKPLSEEEVRQAYTNIKEEYKKQCHIHNWNEAHGA